MLDDTKILVSHERLQIRADGIHIAGNIQPAGIDPVDSCPIGHVVSLRRQREIRSVRAGLVCIRGLLGVGRCAIGLLARVDLVGGG